MFGKNKNGNNGTENNESFGEKEFYYKVANDEIKRQLEQIKVDALKYWATQ